MCRPTAPPLLRGTAGRGAARKFRLRWDSVAAAKAVRNGQHSGTILPDRTFPVIAFNISHELGQSPPQALLMLAVINAYRCPHAAVVAPDGVVTPLIELQDTAHHCG